MSISNLLSRFRQSVCVEENLWIVLITSVPESVSGWCGWKMSLKFKMGNFRTKLARSGCMEVSVNTGKRSKNNPEKEHPHSNIKRARRAEVNYLPNFPRGENQASLEEMRVQIIAEVY